MARTLDLVGREELPSAVALKSVQFDLSHFMEYLSARNDASLNSAFALLVKAINTRRY